MYHVFCLRTRCPGCNAMTRSALRKIRYFLPLLALGLAALAQPGLASENHLKLGVYPHLSKQHLQRAYTAIAKQLSEVTGKAVDFDVRDNLQNFHRHLEDQYYDIILLQPIDYIELADQKKYRALASLKKNLAAIFVVKRSSQLQQLTNLLGRNLYLPPRKTAVSYLARYHLHHSGIDLENDLNIYHEKTHVTCLQKVLIGIASACATAERAKHFFEEKIGVKLRTIARTQEIPHVLFAVTTRMPKKLRDTIRQEIVSWRRDNPLLTEARLGEFRIISDRDYNIVRKIKAEVDNY